MSWAWSQQQPSVSAGTTPGVTVTKWRMCHQQYIIYIYIMLHNVDTAFNPYFQAGARTQPFDWNLRLKSNNTFGAATKPLQNKGCTNHPKHDKEMHKCHKWKLTLQAKSATHAYDWIHRGILASSLPEKNHHHQTADRSAWLECAII